MAEFKERGNEQYQAGNYASAVELYSAGIEQEPTNAALFSNRSAAFLKLQDYKKAKLDADMCIQLDPKWSKVSFISHHVLPASLCVTTTPQSAQSPARTLCS